MTAEAAAMTDNEQLRADVHAAARRARVASRELATLSTVVKDRALHAAADSEAAR